ncbi:MAG TPA: hypothetical protein V6C76_11395 [Drouetiella sp.]
MADAPVTKEKPKDKTPEARDPKPEVTDAAHKATTEIQSMPASAQRATLEQEWNRISKEAGAGLPELKLTDDHGHKLAVITKDGKPTEVIDDEGKKWKPSTTTPGVFTDGKEQRLLMQSGEQQPGQPPHYELAKAKVEMRDGKPVVTEITDGDNRKWSSADGKKFIGSRSDGTANEGDQRFLSSDNNGGQKFEDPTQRTLSPEELARAKETLASLRPDTNSGFMRFFGQMGQGEMGMAGQVPADLTGHSSLEYLSKLNPAALKQLDGAMHLEDYYKDRFNSDEMEKLHKMLRSTDVLGDRADKMFDAPNHMSRDQAGQFYTQMLRGTNSGDMKKLNDDLLEHINADSGLKAQYDAYVAKHQGEPGFNKDTAAILSYAENNISDPKYQAEAKILTAGADKLDAPQQPGGKTPREQLTQLAMDNKDIGMFERAMTGASPEARAKVDKDAATKAFYDATLPMGDPMTGYSSGDPIQTDVSRRNQAIVGDLIDKGEVNPGSLMIGGSKDDAEKILGSMTDAQRASYVKGLHSTNPNDPDRAFYDKVHAGIVEAAHGDQVAQLRLEDQADKKGGSFISNMSKFEGTFANSWQSTIDSQTLDGMSPEDRRDATENYADRRQQLESMVKALGKDPTALLQSFDQQFKPKENPAGAADTSGGAIVGGRDAAAGSLLDKLTKSSAQPDYIPISYDGGYAGEGIPQATLGAQERALMIQKAFKDDPGLLKRLQNPQTDEERSLAKAMDPKALFGDHADQYAALLKDGRLPIQDALKLDPNASPQDVLKYAMSGSQAERDNFLKDPAAAAKLLGDDPAKFEIMKNAIAQGQMKPEDMARAVAVGWLPPESLKDIGGYNGAAEAAYAKKYHPGDSDGSSFKTDIERKIGADNPDYVNFLKQNENVFKSAAADQQIAGVSGSSLMGRLLGDSVTAAQVQQTAAQLQDLAAKVQKEVKDGHGTPEMQKFLEAQAKFQDAIKNNRDAQKELAATIDSYANLAVQGVILAGTGGMSLPAMLAANTGWQMARLAMKSEMLGANYTSADMQKDLHDFTGDALANTALGAVGGAQFSELGNFFKAIKMGEKFSPQALEYARAAHLTDESIQALQARVLAEKSVPALEGGVKPLPALESGVKPLPALESGVKPLPALTDGTATTVESTVPAVVPGKTIQTVDETLPVVQKVAAPPTVLEAAPTDLIPRSNLPVIPELGPTALTPTFPTSVLASEIPELGAKGTYDFMSPGTQEFFLKNGLYGVIGGADESWKGGSFQDGFISYAAVGAAFHGFSEAFKGLKIDVPPSEVRAGKPLEGEILGPEPRIRVGENPSLTGPRVEQPALGEPKLELSTRTDPDGKAWQTIKTPNGDTLERSVTPNGEQQQIIRVHDPKTGAEEVYQSNGNNKWQKVVDGKPEGQVYEGSNYKVSENGLEFKFKGEDGGERSYSRDGWHEDVKPTQSEPLRLADANAGTRVDAAATRAEVQSIVTATEQQTAAAGQALTATEQSLQGDLASLDRASQRIQALPDGPFKTKWEGEIAETRTRIKSAQEEQTKTQDELKGIQTRLKEATEKSDKAGAEQAQRDMEQLQQRMAKGGTEPELSAKVKQMGTDLDATLKVPAVVKMEPAPSLEPYPVPKVVTEPLPALRTEPVPAIIEPQLSPLLAREGGALRPFEEPGLPRLGGTDLTLTDPRLSGLPATFEEGGPLTRFAPEDLRRTGAPFRLGDETGDVTGPRLPLMTRLSPLAVAALGGPIAKDLGGEGEQKPKGDQPVPPKPEPAKLVPNQALMDLATVKNYEGPFHSADRLLQAALGRKPTFEEIRAMTKAIQEEFAAEHGGKSIVQNGLKRGDQFLRPDNVEALLGKLAGHNPALANQMRAYIQSGATPAVGIHSTKAYASGGTHHGGGHHTGGHHYRVTHGHHHAQRRYG